jgi:signal peptidase I
LQLKDIKEDQPKKRSNLMRDVIETVVITVVLFLLIQLVIQNYNVQGPSMLPHMENDERVLVNKTAYVFGQPARGDVIIFHAPCDPGHDYVKRVIGLPGDTVKTDREHVWVNGVQLDEPYISRASNPKEETWKVPTNEYYVLGDNRPISDDSRYWTCTSYVAKDQIVGKATLVYWPLASWQWVDTYSNTFSHVK